MGSETKICQNCKTDFIIEPDDFTFYAKIRVPPPTFCPECRFQRRIAFRNDRKIFRNTSAKSGRSILSLYSPASGVVVYDEDEWKSDDWNALSYGRPYDFSRTFFEQFNDLVRAVPRPARSTESNVNCDYSANIGFSKNCYLLFNSSKSEDCCYGNNVIYSKECFDGSHSEKCERCYELFWNESCYRTHFSSECQDSADVWFSKNCAGCQDCAGCVNLRKKKYCIFNEQYSREVYLEKFKELKLNTWTGISAMRKSAGDFFKKFPVKYLQGTSNVNVSGEYIQNSRNIYRSYLVNQSEDVRHSQYLLEPTTKDCMDISIWGGGSELCYEHTTCGNGISGSKFCAESWSQVRNCEYCMFCRTTADCFGCAGLKNKQYCISNVQYTKSEYGAMREKIIAHMNANPYLDKKGNIYPYGEFFPIEHYPFGYNTSIVSEHFPLSKEEALASGYSWQEQEAREYDTDLSARDIPDAIEDVDDSILSKLISCHECKKAYRIIADELTFLRKEGIPVPRFCADCRHEVRIRQRNPNTLHRRACSCGGQIGSQNSVVGSQQYENTTAHFHRAEKCPNEFETSYSPERPEIIYCEQCYQSEVA
jgi:hypothetical protein